ncbi:MAG: response regulator, partial [Gemmatimonadetes bacterium]|nr:response regulator [Gemmatimonadota bacterium]
VRSIAAEMLSESGFEVIAVSSGEEAMAAFENQESDIGLVVLDRTMPGMDGAEVYARIRKASKEVPVVFMSGYGDAPPAEASDDFASFLQKPFTASQLNEAVEDATTRPPHANTGTGT